MTARIWWPATVRLSFERESGALTRDHSLVHELVEVGEIAADEAAGPMSSPVRSALPAIDLDVREISECGRPVALCSAAFPPFVSDDLRNEEPIDAWLIDCSGMH